MKEDIKEELSIGCGVQWHDNGLRFGWLRKLGYKYCVIEHPVRGRRKVRIEDVFKYDKNVKEVKRDGLRKRTARVPH